MKQEKIERSTKIQGEMKNKTVYNQLKTRHGCVRVQAGRGKDKERDTQICGWTERKREDERNIQR